METLKDLDYKQRVQLIEKTAEQFKETSQQHDEQLTFPFENFDKLKAVGYPALSIPKEYGGGGISLTELMKHQETIAKYDGATALSIGWHMGIIMDIGEKRTWNEEKYKKVVRDVIENGALINNLATEPATGSPTRGGRPETTARKQGGQWILNGRKTFSTLSPVLKYAIIVASIEETDEVGEFLVDMGLPGVTIEETWNSIAMRASGSHDVVLEDVAVEEEHLVAFRTPGKKDPSGWLLHIPACYLGIARAAQDAALKFAKSYSPNSIKGTISELPNVQEKLGKIELLAMEAEAFLYSATKEWDQADAEAQKSMGPKLGAVKTSIVNKAVEIVDLSMRVVGAKSLNADNELQRHYRNVRAGLHNPPMDDIVIVNLAKHSLERTDDQ
ncbi:acyl-CoA dehydrogenase family protein [Salinicoccus kekensis]|uniref:Alkylation response protein AidB-like acyl-CoA dehydrogenase n=1 Tax=Salinicoccus kekensis TaxID=714307 RepID=A0A285USI8_9STAP|nr:acyl-CoA dehydrogenase family protein [Salinicoccus kekensis]SOC43666.1 alkylation response protein AidB-like acyl-CoA dehydrogenase [Salinicoccus kekensis]